MILDQLQVFRCVNVLGSDQQFDYLKVNSHHNTLGLLYAFVAAGVLPTIIKPTRIIHASATLIDNIYVKCDTTSQVFSGIILSKISNHLPILIYMGKPLSVKPKYPLTFTHRTLNDQSIGDIQDELLRTDWTPIITSTINDAFALFIAKVVNTIDKFASEKTVTIPNKQIIRQLWMTKGLMMSSRMKDRLFRKCINKPKTYYLYVQFIKYRNMYNKLKRQVKRKITPIYLNGINITSERHGK